MPFILTKDWLASAPIDSATIGPCPGFARFIWRIGTDWPEAVLELRQIAEPPRRNLGEPQMSCIRLVASIALAVLWLRRAGAGAKRRRPPPTEAAACRSGP